MKEFNLQGDLVGDASYIFALWVQLKTCIVRLTFTSRVKTPTSPFPEFQIRRYHHLREADLWLLLRLSSDRHLTQNNTNERIPSSTSFAQHVQGSHRSLLLAMRPSSLLLQSLTKPEMRKAIQHRGVRIHHKMPTLSIPPRSD